MKRVIFTISLMLLALFVNAQERKLKAIQPNMMELMMFEVKLNPSDTIFNNVNFDYLPVKGFPFFTAVPSKSFYTIEQRDSILKKIDELFYE